MPKDSKVFDSSALSSGLRIGTILVLEIEKIEDNKVHINCEDGKPNCYFTVNAERKDVENFYQAADLFLFTSRGSDNNKETSPLVIREAISFNVPSLIYNLPVYLGMYNKFHNIEYLNFNDLKENEDKILNKLNLAKLNDYVFIGVFSGEDYPNYITARTNLNAVNEIKIHFPKKPTWLILYFFFKRKRIRIWP